MNNFSLNPLFRRSVGFDRLNDLFDYVMQSDVPSYPPYNIEKHGDHNYRIVIATAGFNRDELEINLDHQVLTVSGKAESKTADDDVAFLHKGMAQRSFKLSLRLDEHIEVQQAIYDNGLLSIDLLRVVPEAEQPRKITIGNGSTATPVDVKKTVNKAA